MKSILTGLSGLFLLGIVGASSASEMLNEDAHSFLAKKVIFECGNFETALTPMIGPYVSSAIRTLAAAPVLKAQLENSFFLMSFLDCQCKARVKGVWEDESLKACLVKAKAATALYSSTLLPEPDMPMDFNELTLEDLEALS